MRAARLELDFAVHGKKIQPRIVIWITNEMDKVSCIATYFDLQSIDL